LFHTAAGTKPGSSAETFLSSILSKEFILFSF
jgi:hypothetical protein